VAYAGGSAFAYLAAAAAAGEAGLERELGAPGQGCCYLGGGVEAAEGCAEWGRGNGDYGAAEEGGWGEPLDSVGDQVGCREEAAKLERGYEVAGYGLVRGRGPGSVDAWGAGALQGVCFGETAGAAGAEDGVGAAGAATGGAKGWDEGSGDCMEEAHGPIVRARGARVARRTSNVCHGLLA
jgi:hypothetical protein